MTSANDQADDQRGVSRIRPKAPGVGSACLFVNQVGCLCG